MVAFPVFDIDDLAEFTGRPVMMLPAYSDEAIDQAAFLIRIRTKIKEWPDDPDLQRTLRYAILELGNMLQLGREYDRIEANPLSSETAGSYSWSKSNAAQTSLYKARPTGIRWLDVLLDYLDDLDEDANPMITHGSTHVFENDGVYSLDGERYVISPDHFIGRRRLGRGSDI